MKRAFLFAVVVLLLAACAGPLQQQEEATVTVRFGVSANNARAVYPPTGVNVGVLDELVHKVSFSGPGSVAPRTYAAGTTSTGPISLVAGTWTIKVEAYHQNELYAVGQKSQYISAGSNSVTIEMSNANPRVIRIDIGGAVSGYSQEGKPANLTGLSVRLTWDNGNATNVQLDGTSAGQGLVVNPPIMGEAQLNPDDLIVAAPTLITIAHQSNPGIAMQVNLPGVQALKFGNVQDAREALPADSAPATGTGQIKGAANGPRVVGNSLIAFTGNFGTLDIYEDAYGEECIPPIANALSSLTVEYLDLFDGSGTKLLSGGREAFSLTEGNLFPDYRSDFLADNVGNPLDYGIDQANREIAVLISRGEVHGSNDNRSVYLLVPYEENLHYVREIEVTGFKGISFPGYFLQTDVLDLDFDGWNALLIGAGIELKVYYDSATQTGDTSRVRGTPYFTRASQIHAAGVLKINKNSSPPTPNVTVMDNSDFGLVTIAYFSSLRIDGHDPVGKGNLPNFATITLPIVVCEQGSVRFVPKPSTPAGGLTFIEEKNPQTSWTDDNGTTWTGSKITQSEFKALQNSYQFIGTFAYTPATGSPVTVMVPILPPSMWSPLWFSPAFKTNEIDEQFAVSVTVKGLTGSQSLFNGEEAEFTIKLYPKEYGP